ncbi:histone-like nucleoid-structuring protein Lsr2 [Streptomyces sp. NPDC051546]|uniref:Lsr2 dimerization domain-containing protein n=1 Tax=Streptomyces sp. NPDC051546 TaxID=3365655 RepID=UPI0037B40542
MATITRLIMIDDLDGTESTESGEINTVRFNVDGVDHEIDLTAEHDQELRELLAPFIAAARTATAARLGGRRRSSGDPERDAQRHYSPIKVPKEHRKRWLKRLVGRAEGSQKVAEWTLVERIEALTDFNVKLLGQYMGLIPTSSGRLPKLSSSEARFRNLEVLDFSGNVTEFGRYAYSIRAAA